MRTDGDYISREAAIGRLDELERTAHHNSVLWPGHVEECREALRDVPAADVRPVVLCQDCVHYEMGVCLKIYDDGAANKDAWQERKPEDFCSYGEKREES